jgi:hypothetical protein
LNPVSSTAPTSVAVPPRAAFLDRVEPFVAPPATRFIAGNPIARMYDAAARNDLDASRVQRGAYGRWSAHRLGVMPR